MDEFVVVPIIFIAAFVIICASTLWFEWRKENAPYNKELARGIYDKVEYLQGNYSASNKTILYFADGRTHVLQEHRSIPYSKGDAVVVLSNGAYKKIEKVS